MEPASYQPTPYGSLWHAVLYTYIHDAKKQNDFDWVVTFQYANSLWTQGICDMIYLDHKKFIKKLLKIREDRKQRKAFEFKASA